MSDGPVSVPEIRARAEAATPGEWAVTTMLAYSWWNHQREPAKYGTDDKPLYEYVLPISDVDATFIAHARSDIPFLLDALAAAETREAELREALEAARGEVIHSVNCDIPGARGTLRKIQAVLVRVFPNEESRESPDAPKEETR